MTSTEALSARKFLWNSDLFWPLFAGGIVLAVFVPTFIKLAEGPWQTEQEGHGPLILAASLWLVWTSRSDLQNIAVRPAPIPGWALLIVGLVMLFVARTQDLISIEAFS